jgi:RNA polymerase sigma-70 factor, ECF subfamily
MSEGFTGLVERIQAGEEQAASELYGIINRGIRFFMRRSIGQGEDLDDNVHDAFIAILDVIRKGQLRNPECLMGLVRTIVHRQIGLYIGEQVERRKRWQGIEDFKLYDSRPDPEKLLEERERRELMASTLKDMTARDREILTRFYVEEQTEQEICEAMSLNRTQFRLLKSRAKARAAERGMKTREYRAIPLAMAA